VVWRGGAGGGPPPRPGGVRGPAPPPPPPPPRCPARNAPHLTAPATAYDGPVVDPRVGTRWYLRFWCGVARRPVGRVRVARRVARRLGRWLWGLLFLPFFFFWPVSLCPMMPRAL